jgi:hypothetical protein
MLAEYKRMVDAQVDYAAQVVKAKELFKQYNRKGNRTFDEVKRVLRLQCQGAQRCAYCEDSVGDEVEHMRPKDHFPAECFEWRNYVFACGGCNGPKNNKYAVYPHGGFPIAKYGSVSWPKGSLPPNGRDVLLDVRQEDPLQFALLDLRTMVFVPFDDSKAYSISRERFEYTYNEVLNLSRELLLVARRDAYFSYRGKLRDYVIMRDNDVSQNELDKVIDAIRCAGHRTVWEEMKRYHNNGWLYAVDNELEMLFRKATQALGW